jgi:outer membrane receptor protein involved in Fe transport
MNFKKVFLFKTIFFLVLLGIVNPPRAGVTGKISGVVTDINTGEPLVGVNISVEGTHLGASTDADGAYFILQVSPGRYTLLVSYIGYAEVRIENVKVSVDHTARVSVELEEKAIELGDEIVITAKRPVIQKDVTSSTQFVDLQELEQLPITDAREGIFLQTGVLFDGLPLTGGMGAGGKGEPRYSIRGGSQDEVKWFVDGVRASSSIDARADRGGSFTNINLNAIEEVQVITGGFNAEYGEAQSGIVNVITKEGGDRFSGSAEFIYGIEGQHHFGNYIFDRNTQKEFIDNLDTTRNDGSLDPRWWTDYRQRQVYDYTKIPDRTLYLSLGGPLLRMGNTKGTFFISSQLKEEAYLFPRPRDTRNLENIIANTVFYIGPTVKLRLSGLYNHEAHSTLQENADFTHQAKYYRGWGSLLDTYTYSLNAQWTMDPYAFLKVLLRSKTQLVSFRF